MAKKVYVGNLPFSVTEADLRSIFGEIGTVESVKVITDRFSGRPKGFAFVEMANDEDAAKAISQFDGGELEGRPLKVMEAKPETKKTEVKAEVQSDPKTESQSASTPTEITASEG